MDQAFAVAALWVGLVLIATFLGTLLKISNALMEITAGAVATRFFGPEAMGANLPWLTFIASTGAVVPTLIAGGVFLPRHLLNPQVAAEMAADAEAVRLRRRTEPPAPPRRGPALRR